MKNRLIFTLIGLSLVILTPVTLHYSYLFVTFRARPGTPVTQDQPAHYVFYEVPRKTSIRVISEELFKLGVVSDANMFLWYGRITGARGKIKAGDYRFSTAMTPNEVFDILTSGISYAVPVTIPEGYNFRQITELFSKQNSKLAKEFLNLCQNINFIKALDFKSPYPKTLEGYLFPDTYLIGRKTTAAEIIHQMIRKYRQVYTPEISERAKAFGFSEHEVVTLASIIEKETGAPEERQLVSSVFHNRLKKKMKLQTDPTVIYGIKNYNGNITRKDLLTPTPYNTYVIPGLPPGPIANPGKAAIEAAVNPATSKYLFFASKNDGTHQFSETMKDHEGAVKKYLLNPKAREGKSWRDLSKKLHNQSKTSEAN